MAERILVTGGAGFIGSRLVARMFRAGHEVHVIDNLLAQVDGPDATFPKLEGPVIWRRDSVTDVSAMREIVSAARPSRVFHLAAETGTRQSLDEVARYCVVNVMGTAHLIEALREAGLSPRIVLASTRAVYGEGAWRRADGATEVPPARRGAEMREGRFLPVMSNGSAGVAMPTPETMPPNPASIYASSKLMQEHMLRQAAEAAGWKLAVLRFQNVYGPGQSLRNPYTGVLSVFVERLMAGGDLNIFEDGDILRDFVFVDDVVEALMLTAEASALASVPINIGMGEGVSILEVARLLARLCGRDPGCVRVSGDFRDGDIRHAVADVTRARALLGWAPRTGIEAGATALVAWARAEREASGAAIGKVA